MYKQWFQVGKLFCSTEVGPMVFPLLHPAPSNPVTPKRWTAIANDQMACAGVPQVNRFMFFKGGGGGGGVVQAFHFGKSDFELGVRGEGQDTSRHFEGSFGSMCVILPM